jgi:hypothetical protein
MLTEELESEVETERLRQVYLALRNILYWQGNQYVVPKFNAANGTFDVTPVEETGDKQIFRSVFNIYEADGLGFIGAVAPRAPNPMAVPDSREDEEQEQAARSADGLLRYFWNKWDANSKQKTLAYHGWTTGPSFGYTYHNADGHKYGFTTQPVIDIAQGEIGPEGIQVPNVSEFKDYPNGDVELEIVNSLYVTVPFAAKELSEVPWLCFEKLQHKAVLLDLYGEELEKILERETEGSSAAKRTAIQAQTAVVSPSARAESEWKQSQWRHARYWIRPSLYVLLKAEVESSDGFGVKRLRDVLKDQFPDGLMIALVNGQVVAVRHEKLDDHWSVCKTGKGETILEGAWGNSTIVIQDNLNRLGNMGMEIILRTITKVMIDSSLIDREKLSDPDNNIAEALFVDTKGGGVELRKMMAEFPQAKMPEALVPFFTMLRQLARDINGVTESLAGAGSPAQTYRAEKQRRDQAMMKFVPFVEETKKFWKHVGANAVRLKARYGTSDQVTAPKGDKTEVVDLAMLRETGWHVEAEEGIPVSIAEETDRIMGLIQETQPDVPEKLGIWAPQNLPTTYRTLGIRGIVPPGENERRKFEQVLKRLLAEPPLLDMDPMTGMEVRRPTVAPDKFDTFDMMAELARQWLLEHEATRQSNPDGFDNVAAYFEAQKAEADMLAMQMAPPPEGGAPPSPEEAPAPGGDVPPTQPQPFDTAPPPMA